MDKDEWERRKEGKNTGPRIPTIDVGPAAVVVQVGEKFGDNGNVGGSGLEGGMGGVVTLLYRIHL